MEFIQQGKSVAVVGGGMVGLLTALRLARLGLKVAVIEQSEPVPFSGEQPPDLRISAISAGSIRQLEQAGVWSSVQSMRSCPYQGLETWEELASTVSFQAQELGMAELGHMVENRILQLALWKACMSQENLFLYCPDRLAEWSQNADGVELTLETGICLQADLLIAADGANSRVRDAAGIGVTSWDYRQHCMLINVRTEQPQQDVTWQWFRPQGPLALLPFCGHQACLVWYDNPERIRELSAMTSVELSEQVMQHFPERLGQIEVQRHAAFPLTRRHAQSYTQGRVVLVGDAAHTINPLAGQGVNLGFKDVDALIGLIEKHMDDDWSQPDWLHQFNRLRRPDNLLMQTGMDAFYLAFSNNTGPLKVARNLGLMAAQRMNPLKKKALKYALGL